MSRQKMYSGPSGERGFALVIGLILLVALSISTFAVARTGLVQEKMAGITKFMTNDFFDAETAIKIAEDNFSALTDLTGETLLDSECGIQEVMATEGGVTIRTTYYNPPPNGTNWGNGDGSKVLICHMFQNELVISVNAVGEDGSKHSGHTGDYLGNCANGSLDIPDDAWVTCTEKFGTTAIRLSWQQLYNL